VRLRARRWSHRRRAQSEPSVINFWSIKSDVAVARLAVYATGWSAPSTCIEASPAPTSRLASFDHLAAYNVCLDGAFVAGFSSVTCPF